MKRIWIVLGVYTALIFGCCIGFTYIWGNLPLLLENSVAGWRFFRGLNWFLKLLPSILFSGLIVGCCVQWKTGTSNSEERFSQAMMGRYRLVLLIALLFALLATLSQEIFVPSINKRQKTVEQYPEELEKDVYLADYYLKENKPNLAWQYAEMAFKIDDSDERALYYYRATHDAMETTLSEIVKETVEVEKTEGPIEKEDKGYTVKQLLEKSDEAASEQRWFDAHYWATLASKAADKTAQNYMRAIDKANYAWNRMSSPSDFNNEEEREYYSKKREGYTALNSGDFLKAYYLFLSLSESSPEHAEDPDVIRYLARSKEKLEREYFFIDETDDIENMENDSNIYFCLKLNDGVKYLVYINKMASMKKDGGLVRYLDGFTLAAYSRNGNLLYSMFVPFAKVVAAPVSAFDKNSMERMGIYKKWKSVPEIYLQSVDRYTEGIISKPVYSFETTGIPRSIESSLGMTSEKQGSGISREAAVNLGLSGEASGLTQELFDALDSMVEEGVVFEGERASIIEGSDEEEKELHLKYAQGNILILPMPFDDFDVLGNVAEGPENMNLINLYRFQNKAEGYGFSGEVYMQAEVSRITYPLVILILAILSAVTAWNYRLVDSNGMFKFQWLFLLPVLFVLCYAVTEFAVYLSRMINFVFVGMFGNFALLASAILYIVILFVVSIIFLARKK